MSAHCTATKKLRLTPSTVWNKKNSLSLIINNHTYLLLVAKYLTIGECFSSLVLVSKYHEEFFFASKSNFIPLKRMIINEFGDNKFIRHFHDHRLFRYMYDTIWRSNKHFKGIEMLDYNWSLKGWKFFTKKLSKYHGIPVSHLCYDQTKREYTDFPKQRGAFRGMFIISHFLMSENAKICELKQKLIGFIHWLKTKHGWGEEHMLLWRGDFPNIWLHFHIQIESNIDFMTESEIEKMCSLFFDLMSIAFDDQFMNFKLIANMNEDIEKNKFIPAISLLLRFFEIASLLMNNESYIAKWIKHLKIFIIQFNSEWIIEVYNECLSLNTTNHFYQAFIVPNDDFYDGCCVCL